MACTFSLAFPTRYRHAVDAGCAALDEIERLEEKLSVYRPDSDVSRINCEARERAVVADAEVFAVLEIADRISGATEGAFDIASGALSRAWGFYKGPKQVPVEQIRLAATAASGMRHVQLDAGTRTVRFLHPGVELNLGAIGKGYAIDRALALLASEWGPGAVLMHGGQSSIRAIGAPPGEPEGWLVAIGDPFRPGRAVASVRLRDRALGSSGADHQFFEYGGRRYGHILDPRTGVPALQLASATALAPTAAEADALSTAFFVLGVERTRQYIRTHSGISAVLVTKPRKDQRPAVIGLGLDRSQIEFVLPHKPEPAGTLRQPMPGAHPAGLFQAREEVRHA
ncbi:MAG TPA: FAD:protein FMN transferase [Bryobacteraceae bacterium]|nr:FAD:protein FMN transferase [Bryobacteraceae bacterium]